MQWGYISTRISEYEFIGQISIFIFVRKKETSKIMNGSFAEISNGKQNLWVLFGYYSYKMIREFAKKVFSVDYRNSYCEAISRSLQQTSKCARLVSIPVRFTTPRSSLMALQSRLGVFLFVRILVLVFIWSLF